MKFDLGGGGLGRGARQRRLDPGPVEFLITSEALAQLLDHEFQSLDRETALGTFVGFEADIHRIDQREFVMRLAAEPPI